MSQATLEKKTSVDAGSDLASLVIAFHRNWHTETDDPKKCIDMCRVAGECIELDEQFYGTDA